MTLQVLSLFMFVYIIYFAQRTGRNMVPCECETIYWMPAEERLNVSPPGYPLHRASLYRRAKIV